jgi:small neutral amino acid transporter SnatA (MarC family)
LRRILSGLTSAPFGISLPVVQVGGGLIVIATGWTLLKQRDDEKQDVQETVRPQDTIRRAFYPLTLPLTVGPGSISAAITLGVRTRLTITRTILLVTDNGKKSFVWQSGRAAGRAQTKASWSSD